MKDINFVPVARGHGGTLNQKKLDWVSSDSIVEHNEILINPTHTKGENFKKRIRGNVRVFSDSGGLQKVTLGKFALEKLNLSPESIMQWQQQNAHCGFILDEIPIIKTNVGMTYDKSNFIKYAEKTADNTFRMNKSRTDDKFSLYGIIHGQTHEDAEKWWSVVKNTDCEVDGWAQATKSFNPYRLCNSIFFMHSFLPDKPIHFLGVGRFSRAIILLWYSTFSEKNITYDSTYIARGEHRNFHLPIDISLELNIKSNTKIGDRLPCDCAVCKNTTTEIFSENTSRPASLVGLHNLEIYKMYFNCFYRLRWNRDIFFGAAKSMFGKKIIKALEYLEYGLEFGYERASLKFRFEKEMQQRMSIAVQHESLYMF